MKSTPFIFKSTGLWEKSYGIDVYSHSYEKDYSYFNEGFEVKGHQNFSPIGRIIYEYKYFKQQSKEQTEERVDKATTIVLDSLQENFVSPYPFNYIICPPPNRSGTLNLASLVATRIQTLSKNTVIDISDRVVKMKELPVMKEIKDYEERKNQLRDAYGIETPETLSPAPVGILVLDDILQSGATTSSLARTLRAVFPDARRYLVAMTYLKEWFDIKQ